MKIEIFFGTGGVGKTTLATSRAIYLSKKNKKILLMTIDPSIRLGQILGLKEEDSGTVKEVNLNEHLNFDALLFNPQNTFKKISKSKKMNRILEVVTRREGGLNEIMSLVEINQHLKEKAYDVIILDTPPGSHFIDFLSSSKRINHFFDKTFIEVFNFLNKKSGPSGLVMKIVKTGVDKLLRYLEKVTGKIFVEEFVDAIGNLYELEETFRDALKLEKKLEDPEKTSIFLVTSSAQAKIDDALELDKLVKSKLKLKSTVLINKTLAAHLQDFDFIPNSKAEKLKISMLERENKLNLQAKKFNEDCLTFPEVLQEDPKDQVLFLADKW